MSFFCIWSKYLICLLRKVSTSRSPLGVNIFQLNKMQQLNLTVIGTCPLKDKAYLIFDDFQRFSTKFHNFPKILRGGV